MTVGLVFFEAAFIRMDYHLNSRIAAVVRISPPGKCKHGKVREWDTSTPGHEDGTRGHNDGKQTRMGHTGMRRIQGWYKRIKGYEDKMVGHIKGHRDNLGTAIVPVGTLISSFSIALL